MQTLNDLVAEFHRKQTEIAALFQLMERVIREKDERLSEKDKQPEGRKPADNPA